MAVWAIADLHLSFGVPQKSMAHFGPPWIDYTSKIKSHWIEKIQDNDLILIAGDISWATQLDDAKKDLEWIHELPGTKVILRGNHDYWWTSISKVEGILPPSIHLIQNNAYFWNDIAIGGTRLWDTPEYTFNQFIEYKKNAKEKVKSPTQVLDQKIEDPKIFQRELNRLELSLKALNPKAKVRIAMIHYPPIGADLQDSQTSKILEKYKIDICLFGHLHNVKEKIPFGQKNGVKYYLTSCDYLNFDPLKILS